ncbi:phosphomannomutase [Aliirhizobium smilacinae]|uniref:Phosphomannomutase n=1 Tax=Aliirhizobium smilacinae TaxID=1395944 RepID=A0A5C4XP65_9HYPH|nr:phosphomannomutase [Rhizobium smilacinae]TNM65336.1 phosphomannomutase [Rhizobium smilacinae]
MKFGTSGLRGLVTDLEGRASALYSHAFAKHLISSGLAKKGDKVLVGRDLRPSSPSIAATCIGALRDAGLDPVDCGDVSTPVLALYGLHIGAPSLMITGSHIPADRNGIKFYRADGEIDKGDEVNISAIADELNKGEVFDTPGEAASSKDAALDLFNKRIKSVLATNALSALRIGVYQHSTVARSILVDILRHYSADVVELGFSDIFIPVDTEAVSAETIGLLKGWAGEYRLDAIVSADGDGDRPLVADEAGTPLRGDLLGLVTARALSASVVVTPVTSNSGIEANGPFDVVRTKVGSPFVIAGMQQALDQGRSAVMGFEANGGLLTASAFELSGGTLSPLPTRDSFLPILTVLALAAEQKKPLSSIAADFRLPIAAADRLENFPIETSSALMEYLRQSEANLTGFLSTVGTVRSVTDVDGLRATLTDGSVVHLRPSGNAPEMRCYVEADTQDAAEQLLRASLQLVRQFADQR